MAPAVLQNARHSPPNLGGRWRAATGRAAGHTPARRRQDRQRWRVILDVFADGRQTAAAGVGRVARGLSSGRRIGKQHDAHAGRPSQSTPTDTHRRPQTPMSTAAQRWMELPAPTPHRTAGTPTTRTRAALRSGQALACDGACRAVGPSSWAPSWTRAPGIAGVAGRLLGDWPPATGHGGALQHRSEHRLSCPPSTRGLLCLQRRWRHARHGRGLAACGRAGGRSLAQGLAAAQFALFRARYCAARACLG